MKRIQFHLTQEEWDTAEFQAAARGLKVADYAKAALFSHIDKYASKGVMAEVVTLSRARKDSTP